MPFFYPFATPCLFGGDQDLAAALGRKRHLAGITGILGMREIEMAGIRGIKGKGGPSVCSANVPVGKCAAVW
jgi:hypothetical protein